jgi:hypothetical protein
MNSNEELKKISLDLFEVCKKHNINLACDQTNSPFGNSFFQIENYILDYIGVDRNTIAIDYTVNGEEKRLHYSNEHKIWIQDE